MSAPGDAAASRRPLGGLPAAYLPSVRGEPPAAPPASADPVRFCVFTTVALLTWVFGPAVVAAMAGLGLVAYARAVRGGLRETRCVLRRPWLVLCYLAWACAVGVAGAGWGAWRATLASPRRTPVERGEEGRAAPTQERHEWRRRAIG